MIRNIIRRTIIILMLPYMILGFSIGEFIWWLMENEFEAKSIFEIIGKAWRGES